MAGLDKFDKKVIRTSSIVTLVVVLAGIYSYYIGLGAKVTVLQSDVAHLQSDITEVKADINNLQKNITAFETDVSKKLDKISDTLHDVTIAIGLPKGNQRNSTSDNETNDSGDKIADSSQ